MGMYSAFLEEDIKVLDWDGLKQFLENWKKLHPHNKLTKNMIKFETKGRIDKRRFTFKDWDDIKLISYWYDEELIFLKCVAPYIEGRVYWDYENEEEAGSIEFIDGKCKITTGTMQYTTWKPLDNLKEAIENLSQEEQKLLMISEIER